jgi:hypothetical protein
MLVTLLGASSAQGVPSVGPGYVASFEVSYDSPPFPDTRYRVTVSFAANVCGDPLNDLWSFESTRAGGPTTPPATLTVLTFTVANPADVTSDVWIDPNGAEIARIDFLVRVGAGTRPTLTPSWVTTGDIVNVAATPPVVRTTAEMLQGCPARQPPPPPPPPPSTGTPIGGPATGYPPGKVKLPGTRAFSRITAGQALPSGTVIEVSKGAGVTLTDGGKGRLTIFGRRDGVPSIVKLVRQAGVVELQLTGGNFAGCGKRALGSATKPVHRVWANGKGKFRTRGRYAWASIRGTRWLTADFCDRTLVQAAQGSLLVRDLVAKKNVVVKAPESYSARPK